MAFFRVEHGQMEHSVFGISGRAFSRWEAWCWLLDRAAYKDGDTTIRGHRIALRVGDVPVSLAILGNAWMWSRSSVRRFLVGLEKAGFISQNMESAPGTRTGTPPGTPVDTIMRTVTVCDYGRNRGPETVRAATNDTPPDTGTDTPPDTPPYMLTLKEDKKRRKKDHPSGDSDRQADLLSGEVIAMPTDDVRIAFEAYQAVARELGLSVPKDLTNDRRPKLRRVLKEEGGLAGWAEALNKLRESKWITSGGWVGFSLDGMTNRDNFRKLIAGGYSKVFGQPEETAFQRDRREYLESDGANSFYRALTTKGDGT